MATLIINLGSDYGEGIIGACDGETKFYWIDWIWPDEERGLAITDVKLGICQTPSDSDCGTSNQVALPQYDVRGTQSQLAWMESVMTMPLDKFMDLKADDQPGYDWTDDGCSVPAGIKRKMLRNISARFADACARHDWGYRNFGASETDGLETWYDATDNARRYVDGQLLTDERSICAEIKRGRVRRSCNVWAGIYYDAVELYGGLHFYEIDGSEGGDGQ